MDENATTPDVIYGTDSLCTASGHTETWHIGLHLPGGLEPGLSLPKICNFKHCHKYFIFFLSAGNSRFLAQPREQSIAQSLAALEQLQSVC